MQRKNLLEIIVAKSIILMFLNCMRVRAVLINKIYLIITAIERKMCIA